MGASGDFSRENVLAKFRLNYPGISLPADVALPEVESHMDLVYSRPAGGPPLLLDLFLPTRAASGDGSVALNPAVIVVHGGGWKSGERAMERPFARELARRGFAAATVGYRLGPAGRFPNALLDVKAAVRWLRANAARFGIDAARIGAVGASSGGQLVALAGASNGDARYDYNGDHVRTNGSDVSTELAAVVDIDGLANFADPALIVRETRSPASPTLFLGGSFTQRPEVWREAWALSHVGPRSAPTLFINSEATTPVLPGRAEMHARLRALRIDSEILVMPATLHPFWLLNPWFVPTVEATARFLRRHLSGPATML